jgi:parvulin-like peptidyl-prolyl isomerase
MGAPYDAAAVAMKTRVSILLWIFAAAFAAHAELIRRTGIAAIANDSIVTIQEVEILSAPAVRGLEGIYRSNPEQHRIELFKAQNDALEHLIERRLILDDFKNSGLVFPESIIADQINDIIRNHYGNRAALIRELQHLGTTSEAFRQGKREDLILRAMEGRNVKDQLLISPAKIEAYYQTNLAKYKLDDQVRLRVIDLGRDTLDSPDATCKLAQEILTKLNEGADFAQMASIYSFTSRKEGGDWGWFEEGKLSKGFSEISHNLDGGKHSGVFSRAPEGQDAYWIYFYDASGKITRGRKYSNKEVFLEEKEFANQIGHEGLPAQPEKFYLLRVDEKKIAHTRPLDELRDEIEKDLLIRERARLRGKWIARLKAKSFVRRF